MTDRPLTAAEMGMMQGFPPRHRPTMTTWDSGPWTRWSFQHVRELVPTVEVRAAGTPPQPLPRDERDLGGLRFTDSAGEDRTVAGLIEDSYTDGFLVMHRGRIVSEQYFNAMQPHTLHLSQSVGKSIVGAAAGVLWGQGLLPLEVPLADLVPELAASGYAGATLSQVLDMQSGVAFNEDYTDPNSDMARIDRACGWHGPSPDLTIRDVILSLRQARPHGGRFEYRSIETDVLAWVMERLAGERLADLVSRLIWQPIGAERDACFTVDAEGTALADGGFNATLRDYARFGEMIRNNGRVGEVQVVPEAWIGATRQGEADRFGEPYTMVLPNGAYRRQFWIGDVARGTLMARGVFGQMIYVDFDRALTVAKLSSWPFYTSPRFVADTVAAIEAIGATLE
jgi:CubicO group peptidase (beta-lactamase class C family)